MAVREHSHVEQELRGQGTAGIQHGALENAQHGDSEAHSWKKPPLLPPCSISKKQGL